MPVARLQAEPGLQTVKQSPFARRTPETVPAMAVLMTALVTAPAAAPAQPLKKTASHAARKTMGGDLLLGDMFFDPGAF